MDTSASEIKELKALTGVLKDLVNTQQKAISGLQTVIEAHETTLVEQGTRLEGLDKMVKEQHAFMDELEKDMKDAFKNNGRTIAGWLEEKDRQLAALRGSGGMEARVAELEELVRRLQYRIANR
jgi:septal ring factor EnvC (AmiA/AmiB activator)